MSTMGKASRRRLRVYIAGPITKGDVEQNVRRACAAGEKLIAKGHSPLIPHLTCYLQGPKADAGAGFSHEEWLEVCLAWVEVADVVLRLPGESEGADQEVEYAIQRGITVIHALEEMDSILGDENDGSHSVPPPAIPAQRQKGDPRFHALLKEIGDLHARKQADYGTPEDPFANYRASEDIGIPAWKNAFMRAIEKVNRIKSFIRNGKLANEGVEDSFKDISVCSLIALIDFREKQKQSS